MTLDKLKRGEWGEVLQVKGEGMTRLRMLEMGIVPGTEIQLRKAAPLGDPIEIGLRGYVLTIRRNDARLIDIRRRMR